MLQWRRRCPLPRLPAVPATPAPSLWEGSRGGRGSCCSRKRRAERPDSWPWDPAAAVQHGREVWEDARPRACALGPAVPLRRSVSPRLSGESRRCRQISQLQGTGPDLLGQAEGWSHVAPGAGRGGASSWPVRGGAGVQPWPAGPSRPAEASRGAHRSPGATGRMTSIVAMRPLVVAATLEPPGPRHGTRMLGTGADRAFLQPLHYTGDPSRNGVPSCKNEETHVSGSLRSGTGVRGHSSTLVPTMERQAWAAWGQVGHGAPWQLVAGVDLEFGLRVLVLGVCPKACCLLLEFSV